MPSTIYFTNGEKVRVQPDPDELHGALNTEGGGRVRVQVLRSDKFVYVNPDQITHFEYLSGTGPRAVSL